MAFSGCIQLEEVEILPSVASVGKGAFKGCLNLKEITINPIKTKVDFTAFQDCPKLYSMILTSDESYIKSFNEDPFRNITKIKIHPSIDSIFDSTFNCFTSIKEIIFPSTMKYIGSYAFNKCQSLEKVILPNNSIFSIGYCAFYGCTSLKEIKLPPLEEIDSFFLFGCTSLTDLALHP